MSVVAPGIINQARIKPVASPPSGTAQGYGIGTSYGAGTGYVRLYGLRWSIVDSANLYQLAGASWRARIVAINGDYGPGALAFTPMTDLKAQGYDLLFDYDVEGVSSGDAPTWYAPIVTDEGEGLTVMVSQLLWLAGSPTGILPVTKLLTLCDYDASKFRGGPNA